MRTLIYSAILAVIVIVPAVALASKIIGNG